MLVYVVLAAAGLNLAQERSGNRSLFANPLAPDIKNRVNEIKQRQKFRPFAPIVLDEYANDIFDLKPNVDYSYMQYAVKCKDQLKFGAICHIDGTARVQVLKRCQNPWLYDLIKLFHKKTGCPMLLNTSLNVKGEPLVNSLCDCINFADKYNVKVFKP